MAKPSKQSSTKKVQRAARSGGGRRSSAPRQSSMLWPAVVSVTVVLGILLIVLSRNEAQDRAETEHPRLVATTPEDHWHMAYGINICGVYQPPLSQVINSGIHTHGEGLIHQEAQSNAETGKRSTIGKFVSDYGSGFRVTDTELRIPGGETYKEGEDKCGDENGRVAAYLWATREDEEPRIITENIDEIRIRNEQVITFAFVAPGEELEVPSSVSNLDDPNAAEGGANQVPPTTAAESGSPGTTQEPVPFTTVPAESAPPTTTP